MSRTSVINVGDPISEVIDKEGEILTDDNGQLYGIPLGPDGTVLTADRFSHGGMKWVNIGAVVGAGDVDGPASATNNAIARFDGTTGKLIKNSAATLSDNSTITLTNPAWNGDALQTYGAGEATPMFTLTTDGRLMFGNGSGDPLDTVLRYQGAGSLLLGDVTSTPNGVLTLGTIDARTGIDVQGYIRRNGADVGDVTGPAAAADNAIARFDGTTGKLVQNSSVQVEDSGNVIAPTMTISLSGISNGRGIIVGSSTVTPTATPTYIGIDGTYWGFGTPYLREALKLRLIDTFADFKGFGAATDGITYVNSAAAESHVFYNGTAEVARINSTGLSTNKLISSVTSGEAIKIDATTQPDAPSTNPPYITLGNKYYSGTNKYDIAGLKLRIYESGTVAYGIGASASQLNYIVSGVGSHAFYTNGGQRAVIDGTGVTAPKLISTATSGEAIKVGTAATGGSAVANPLFLSLGNSFYSGTGSDYAGIKLRLYDDGTGAFGFGVTTGSFNYRALTGTDVHRFYTGTTNAFTISSSGITTPAITTASGDLSLSPAGTNINMNGKNLTSVNSLNSRYLTQTSSAQGDYFHVTNGNTTTAGASNIMMNSVAGTNGGIMVLGFNGGLNNGGDMRFNTALSRWEFRVNQRYGDDGPFTLSVWNDTVNATLLYARPSEGTFMQFPGGLKTTSIRATNTTGGTIDFNGATLSNCTVSGGITQSSGTTTASATGFTGTMNVAYNKVGNLATITLTGVLTASGTPASFAPSVSTIPAGYRPNTTISSWSNAKSIDIGSTGFLSVAKANGSNFTSGEVMNLDNVCLSCTYVAYN